MFLSIDFIPHYTHVITYFVYYINGWYGGEDMVLTTGSGFLVVGKK